MLRRIVLAGVLLGSLPLWLFVGFGLWRGHDVLAAFQAVFRDPAGTTVPLADVPVHTPRRVEWLGNLEDLELAEASGLAVSTRRDDLLWAHNDSGNPHDVFALDSRGRALGTLRVDDSRLGDWEDMASFRLDGRSYLMLGDVGDNYRWRRELELIVIEEPEVPSTGLPPGSRAQPAWVLRYAYPDGHLDCEALAVDPATEEVLLIVKQRVPARVYRIPLRPSEGDVVHIAERIATLDALPQPDERVLLEDPEFGEARSQPTAFDIARDLAAVITYGDAYLYPRAPGATWAETFRGVPLRVALPPASQREAGALAGDASRLFVTSERGRRGEAALFGVELGPDLLTSRPE